MQKQLDEYRVLSDFPNYEIYRDGTVIRRQRMTKKGIRLPRKKITASKAKNGYLTVRLNSSKGKIKTYYLHRLVWEAFNGKIPKGIEICHINCNREDCSLENLQASNHRKNCQNPRSLENYRRANARDKGKYDYDRLQRSRTKEYENKVRETYMMIVLKNGYCGVWHLMNDAHCGYGRACRIIAEMRGNADSKALS